MKQIFFLAGLPRSGSTLLGSILSQRPDTAVTPTSPILDLLCSMNDTLTKCKNNYTYDYELDQKIYENLASVYFNHFPQGTVIDKHRGWPKNVIPAKQHITATPKILCTYRPISAVITSYLKLIHLNESDNFIDNDLHKLKKPLTTENRAERLWDAYISDPYNSLTYGLKHHREHIHLINYDDLIKNPQVIMSDIYNFLGLDNFTHDFNNIVNACVETKDAAWGLKGLHDIRSELKKISAQPTGMLGSFLTYKYDQFNIRV